MPHKLARKLASDLIKINTVNPPGNEAEAVRLVVPVLQDAGFSIKEHPYGPGRSSLVARSGKTDCRPVMLSGHLDTVPLGTAAWSCPPFSGNVVDGRLYGRGAADMKSGVAALIASAVHFVALNPDAPLSGRSLGQRGNRLRRRKKTGGGRLPGAACMHTGCGTDRE